MNTRLYKFFRKDDAGNPVPGSERLIEAASDAIAIKYGTKNTHGCVVATSSEAVKLGKSGVEVEVVPVKEKPTKTPETPPAAGSEAQGDSGSETPQGDTKPNGKKGGGKK